MEQPSIRTCESKSLFACICVRRTQHRSATLVANIAESKYVHSRTDFIAKLEIALKEVNETGNGLKCSIKQTILTKPHIKELTKLMVAE
ncbi:MAG: four helix bundle protein [Clostridia bacterium]|nr:four helix bundle protein [Clostridia bacterium]